MSDRATSRSIAPAGLLPASGVGRALLFAGVWTIVGLIYALPNLSGEHVLMPLAMSLTQWWAWGLIAALVVAVDRRLPISDRQLARRLAAHLPLSVIVTCFYYYVAAALRAICQLGPWTPVVSLGLLRDALGGMFLWGWLVYWVILGAWLAFQYYERFLSSELRRERLERNFSEARLNALRLQLDPHFLFNALNTVSSQVERDPKLARRMIEHLGDLLRLSLDSKDRQEVALIEELAFLEHYLAIQRIRFGENLRIETDVVLEVRHASVPSLILQPLVENAVRHGLGGRAAGGTVIVIARPAGDRLEIHVQDDGVGLPAGWQLDAHAGVGLSVTKERIAELHPNGSSRFVVLPRATGGTDVEISLPLRLVGERRGGEARA